ncbi:PDC1, partial [Symbiodinium sp. KB8]
GSDLNATIRVFTPITAAAVRIETAEEAIPTVDWLLRVALDQQRPVYLEIPFDMQRAEVEVPGRLNYQPPSSDEQALRKVVEQVAHAVNSAGKVGVLVGVFVDRDGLQQVPVLDATEGADILLTLGMPRTEFNLGFLTHDFKEDRMIELGHDTANVMGEEVHGVYLRHLLPLLAQKISPRAEEVFEDTFPFTYTKQREVPENRPLTVDFMYPQLAHFVQEGDIVTGNTGGYINMSRMRLKKGNTTVGPTNWASLGSVFPISIGMAFAAPE